MTVHIDMRRLLSPRRIDLLLLKQHIEAVRLETHWYWRSPVMARQTVSCCKLLDEIDSAADIGTLIVENDGLPITMYENEFGEVLDLVWFLTKQPTLYICIPI